MASDGKVTISTALDNSDIEKGIGEISGEFGGLKKTIDKTSKAITGAMSKSVSDARTQIQKELSATQKEIDRYQKQIQKANSGKMPLAEQAERLGVELDKAKGKLAELQAQQQAAGNILSAAGNREMSGSEMNAYLDAYANKPGLDTAVTKQQAQVDALQKEWDKVNDKIDSYNLKISQADNEMASQKANAKELTLKLDAAERETKQISKNVSSSQKAFGSMSKSVKSFASRLKSIALGALVFNGISAGLREVTSYLGTTLKTSKTFTTELARLKGALLTAFQPIYNVVAPALTYLMKILTSAVLVVAQFFASLAGTTIEASAESAKKLYEEANAFKSVEKNAKKAQKSVAGFDELNVLQDKSTNDSSDTQAPDFSVTNWFAGGQLQTIKDNFKEIAKYIGIAAAGIAGFKLGSFIADLLTANIKAKTLKETIGLLGKKAVLTLGITLAITGGALETKGIISTIQEGLNSINFAEIIGGGSMLAGGGAMIGKFFGSAILGGAIGGIVAGIPAFITGIYDAIVGGIDWLNAALIGAGATAAGAGIGAIIGMLGGPIGAGIGALIGLAVGLVTDLVILIVQKWDEICAFFAPTVEWFDSNVIQPVGEFFSNLWVSISQWASDAWEDIKEFFTPAVQWFSDLFNSVSQTLSDIFYNIGVIASGCWEVIKVVWGIVSSWFNENVVQPVAGFFTTLWDGFVEKAKAAWEGVKTVFGNVASFFSDTFQKAWAGIVKVFSVAGEIFNDIKDGILTAFKSIVNGIIKGLNSAISVPFNGINTALRAIKNIKILDLQPFAGLRTISVPQIPYLAQGAVLPPNKPFMAVVGDQKHGTNVEAPLATIQEAVALVMQDQTNAILAGFESSIGVQKEILEAVLGIQIGDDVIGSAVARYNRKRATMTGGTV